MPLFLARTQASWGPRLKTELAEVERARKANLRASVRLQLVGLVLFTLGTVAATIGSVLS